MEFIFILIGIASGALAAWFAARYFYNKPVDEQVYRENSSLQSEKSRLEGEIKVVREQFLAQTNMLEQKQIDNVSLRERLTRSESDQEHLLEKLELQKKDLQQLQEKFSVTFENLANKIFDEKTQKFTDQNSVKLETILKPLNEKIKDFEKTVRDTYEKSLTERTELKTELLHLKEFNKQISEDTVNLTKALKGDVKLQGDWGEMVLERILESSGLQKDLQYKLQENFKDENGKNQRPDAIVYLPDDKHILIDSKVSLVAYERVVNCLEISEQTQFIKEHLISVKKHVDELSTKAYQRLPGLNSPEYVLMFIPVEASFGVAMQHDKNLFDYAWKHKIVIVSPSTLIATLMTIASIWKQEMQTQNAMKIAERGGKLYDKFVGFVEDLKRLGTNIEKAQIEYNQALNKLSSGSGNLIGQAEKLRKLGAKNSKELPGDLINEE
jgi:DNA recombination protein RmuC